MIQFCIEFNQIKEMKEILIVEDHLLIREAIKIYLNKSEKYKVLGEAENGTQAFECIANQSFDLILTDLNMPITGGIELIEDIRLNFPNQLVATLSMDYDDMTIRKLFSKGVHGFFVKNVTQKNFLNGLDQIFRGELVYPNDIAEILKRLKLEKQGIPY